MVASAQEDEDYAIGLGIKINIFIESLMRTLKVVAGFMEDFGNNYPVSIESLNHCWVLHS